MEWQQRQISLYFYPIQIFNRVSFYLWNLFKTVTQIYEYCIYDGLKFPRYLYM